MSFKIILAVIGGHSGDRAVLDAAHTLAMRFGSQIDVLHVRADPYTLPYLDAGVAPSIVAGLLSAVDVQIQARRDLAYESFTRWRTAAGLEALDLSAPAPGRPAARWIERKGAEAEIGAQGRFADLIVLAQPSREQENVTTAFLAGAFESALFGAPKPVLTMPAGYEGRAFLDGPVAIAWNGSLEADRALAAALPFITAAGSATVIVGDEPGRRPAPDVAGLTTYLKRHGIEAQLIEIKVESASSGRQILNATQDAGCRVLVMGAYTHGRLRQFVLGGVTDHVSTHARIPVLMAH